MPDPTLSIIIPTYNRKAILRKALDAYAQQTARDQILEILVVDDGSSDGTGELVSECAANTGLPLRCLRKENGGLASARNHGIREARGKIILFIDDDIIPAPSLVEEHLAWHNKCPDHKIGVLGNVPWSPEVNPTPFQHWWGLGGIRFHPPHMFPGCGVSFPFMLFCNTSLKADLLVEVGPFDERFRTWGCEDTDYAYRLVRKSGKVLFNPDAVGYHYKRVLFSEACKDPEKVEISRRYFATKESGIRYAELRAGWESSRGHQMKRFLARWLVPVLSPLKPILDSKIPLPARIYDVFYLYYGDMRCTRRRAPRANRLARQIAPARTKLSGGLSADSEQSVER